MTVPKKPFLAVVDGTTLPPAATPPRQPRKGKRSASDREGTAIAAAHTIEQLLPALVELKRVWAAGTIKAGAYHEAHATDDAERYHRVPILRRTWRLSAKRAAPGWQNAPWVSLTVSCAPCTSW